jgi:uncharacterized membrane protein
MRKSIKSVDIEPDDYIKAFRCILMIAGGVFLIICAAALMIGLSAFGYKYGLIAFFSILIVAIFLMVFGGISWDIFNKKYTLPSGDSAHHSVKAKKLEETICGVIMLLATATFFLLGFVWEKWHPGWVVFPIGGILCAIVSTILKGVDSTKS